MLFKRIIEGKSVLNAENKNRSTEKCSRRQSECGDGCWTHSSIIEESLKMAALGFMLWAGVLIFGSHVAPYPLNLVLSTDNLHPPPMYDVPFPSAFMLRHLPHITPEHVNSSVEFAEMIVAGLSVLEENIHNAGIEVQLGSPAHGMLITGYPSEEAMDYDKSSLIVSKASLNLIYSKCSKYGVSMEECASLISTMNLGDSIYGQECAILERFSCGTQKKTSRFRTFDGSCNNPVRSSWGQALTGYRRLLHPKYGDGIMQPRNPVNTRLGALPSPRTVSQALVEDKDVPDEKRSIAVAVWSQFVQNDISHTPVKKMTHHDYTIRCCRLDSGFNLSPRYRHPSCLPISVTSKDSFYKDVDCMEYTRSVTTYRGDCTFGAAEQMNQVSHFLDGSNIYGSNAREAASLRASSDGLMKTHEKDGQEFLPLHDKPMEKCMVDSKDKACFKSGDVRSNMHPWLTSLHTLMVREHNRLARALSNINPEWGNDRLFHEARRILLAELQHITYQHWVPAVMGKSFDELNDNYEFDYNQDTNPTVTNSVATAVFHFVNSMLDGDIQFINESRNITKTVPLMETYYKPGLVMQEEGMNEIIRGMVTQRSQRMDLYLADDLSDGLYSAKGVGVDVLSITVQKEREHGLPGYAQYRALCGNSMPHSFRDLTDLIPHKIVEKFEKIYKDVRDVDLVVGAMAEEPLPNSVLGPTFTCLLKEQLWRLRSGDRYFYTHSSESGNTGAFTRRQLAEIRKASLSRVLCDNADVDFVQKNAFNAPSNDNPILSCDEIKKPNLEMWRDPSKQPDLITRTSNWIKTKVTG